MVVRALALVAVVVASSGCLAIQGLDARPGARPALAAALMDADEHPVLLVEFGVVAGRRLDSVALIEFQRHLGALTGRTAIAYTDLHVLPPQGGNYTPDRLRAIHHASARIVDPTHIAVGGIAQLHVLVLDGRMASHSSGHLVLGTLIPDAGVLVVLPDTYATAHRIVDGVPMPATGEMDRHVLLHELGHAVGLVNRGVPMVQDHEDAEHPGHSSNRSSLLHHRPPMAIDGTVHGAVAHFDQDDLADLASFRATLTR